MTEQEWLEVERPSDLLDYLQGYRGGPRCVQGGDRKLRLFSAACCRRLLPFVRPDAGIACLIDVSEGYADGLATRVALQQARQVAVDLDRDEYLPEDAPIDEVDSARARAQLCDLDECLASERVLRALPERDEEEVYQVSLLRCLFGNPFRSVAVDRAWRTRTVLQLVEAAYAERELPSGHLDAARLAVLADALEEAGCDSAALLAHLRGPGPHVRGCWALDLVLGKV